MAYPDSWFVEVEFTAGVWTDVTGYVDWSAGGSTRFGRPTLFSQVGQATFNITLDNIDGRFTPLRQTLKPGYVQASTDPTPGSTANPYWPNLLPRKRIRYGYVISATRHYRFTGYVDGWPPTYKNPSMPRSVITATDRLRNLAGVQMQRPLPAEILADSPAFYWPLTDEAGSSTAVELVTGLSRNALSIAASTEPALTFGDDGPGVDNGSGVRFNGEDDSPGTFNANKGQYLVGTAAQFGGATGWSAEVWFAADSTGILSGRSSSPTLTNWILKIQDASPPAQSVEVVMRTTTGALVANAAEGGSGMFDDAWHQAFITYTVSTDTLALYVDGALVSSAGGAGLTAFDPAVLQVGGEGDVYSLPFNQRFKGKLGSISVYNSPVSSTRIAAHYEAGASYAGELSHERLARFLGYAGLTAPDYDLDTSTVALSTYSQDGQDIAAAAAAVTESEGGGSVFYVDPDGTVLFRTRDYRRPAAALVTVDQEADMDGNRYTPAFDADNLVNSVAASRATGSGTQETYIFTNSGSVATYGLATGSVTSYAQDPADVRSNGQYLLAAQSEPGFRIQQVPIDLTTAQTAGLFAAVAAVRIGDRIRVTNLPAAAAPATSVDLIVEGWRDDFSDTGYTVTFDTSPADNPAPFIWQTSITVGSVANAYSRWQADGQTLNAALTSSATTVVIATAAGKPKFTTNAAMYPLTITVGEERIQLNTAPGGATSPQTFTGVTRGVAGTTAAAQASGAAVTLYPRSTWTL